MSQQMSLGVDLDKPIPNSALSYSLRSLFPEGRAVAVDVETHDPDLKKLGPGGVFNDPDRGHLVGVAIAPEGMKPVYLPLFHHGGGNFENPHAILDELKDAATAASECTIVGHNLLYDLEWLSASGVHFEGSSLWCTKAAESVINDRHQSYSLKHLAQAHGLPDKLDPPGGPEGIASASGRRVISYATRDAELALDLYRRQSADMVRAMLLESRLLKPLHRLRMRGVRVNEALIHDMIADRTVLTQKILSELGIESFNTEGDALTIMQRCGISAQETEKGGVKRDKSVFASSDHPTARRYAEGKNAMTELGLLETLQKHWVDGRVHPLYLNNRGQGTATGEGDSGGGARFGRLSCKSPNIQQQPSDAAWRKIFLPEEGEHWVSADYSQQEPRLALALAVKWGISGAKEVAARYHADAALDYHTMTAEITGLDRHYAKRIFLGSCYGMGKAKMAENLGVSMEKADELLKQVRQTAPYIGALSGEATRRAEKEGHLTSALGRRYSFGNKAGDTFPYKALNRLVQGNASEQTKMALVVLDDVAGITPICQVHDEICVSIPDQDGSPLPRLIAETTRIMEAARVDLHRYVPPKADIEVGRSWGESCEK